MVKANLIAGEWVTGDDVCLNINPSDTNDVIAEYAKASPTQVDTAIAAASEAAPAWAAMGIQQRADILDKVGQTILARKEELGRLLSREEGKTLPEGIGEAARAGYIFKFFAAEVLRQDGQLMDSVRPGLDVSITRSPVGTVGIITPWNFPIAIPAWKIAPALAYGNTVVFKPAELVPGCAHALVEIIHEAGVPAGVLNLLVGKGSIVGAKMVEDARVNAISFTGSVGTGRSIAQQAASRMAKFQLEMGGKNPLIVMDDADLNVAVNCAVQGAFFSTGQRCTASSRLIVTEGIHDQFVDACVAALSKLKIDNALGEGTDIGPVVDESQLGKNLEYINIGQAEGANLVFGGERVERATPGFYMTPALFTGTTPDMRINREEIFGPVATVLKAGDFDEAMALANDTEFGLSSGICTTSLKHATEFKRQAKAGMCMVNVPTAGVDYHVPFGGTKGSSYGPREQGSHAKEFYTTVKTSYTLAV
ncbi:MAG: aldehyde dehydrogenase family protein [bacterium]